MRLHETAKGVNTEEIRGSRTESWGPPTLGNEGDEDFKDHLLNRKYTKTLLGVQIVCHHHLTPNHSHHFRDHITLLWCWSCELDLPWQCSCPGEWKICWVEKFLNWHSHNKEHLWLYYYHRLVQKGALLWISMPQIEKLVEKKICSYLGYEY